jgi:hypothetical protein
MIKHTFLLSYGLDILLTELDDPELWEAALRQHWPAPDSPDCLVDALRFDIGRCLGDGEQPQGEVNEQYAKMRGMVDIQEWCFERVDDTHLRVKPCPSPTQAAPSFFLGPSLSAIMSGQIQFVPPSQVVFMYLGISRPSQLVTQAVVYAGSSAPGVGEGSAHIWQRLEYGHWEQSDQRVAWWIT